MSLFRDNSAVQLSIEPTKLAARVFGTITAATKTLGLPNNKFHHYDRRSRMPYTVFSRMLAMDPTIDQYLVDVQPVRGRPFLVPRAVFKAQPGSSAKSPTKSPAKAASTVSTDTSAPVSRQPMGSVAEMVAVLEQENRELRRQLEGVRASLTTTTRE